MKLFLLRCPKCRHTMNYQSKDCILLGKRKKCVYCNHSFKIRENITKSPKKIPQTVVFSSASNPKI